MLKKIASSISQTEVCFLKVLLGRELILACIFLLSSHILFGQPYSSKDLPSLTSDFFKGTKPEGSKYPAFMHIETHYKWFRTTDSPDSIVKLNIKIKVVPDSAKSYFPASGLSQVSRDELLKHELGHIIIGFIVGNALERKMSEVSYTKNFRKEVVQKYLEFSSDLNVLHDQYDNETKHGTDRVVQLFWDKKLIEILNSHDQNNKR